MKLPVTGATEGEADLLAETAGEEAATDEPIDDQILNEEETTNGDTEVKEESAESADMAEAGEEVKKDEGTSLLFK
jgi:hypothetical protein